MRQHGLSHSNPQNRPVSRSLDPLPRRRTGGSAERCERRSHQPLSCGAASFGRVLRQFKWAISSRQVFKWLQMTQPETLTDIQRAARFYYLQQHAFGGKVSGQNFGTATTAPAINLCRIEENLSAAHLRLSGTTVENLDWQNASNATTVLTHSSTLTLPTGKWKATVFRSSLTSMKRWPPLCVIAAVK